MSLVSTLWLLFALSVKADQITFQEGVNGYAGTHDTELSQASPNAVNGNLTSYTVDLEDPAPNWGEGMLKFANIFGTGPNQIRPGTNIIVARLRLYTVNPGSAGPHIHRMLFDWDESTASWNSMACCGNLTGGVQADDVDATTTDHDGDGVPGITVPNVGTANTFTEFDVTADVQAWSDGAPNYGWAMIANGGDGWDWVSSETGIADQRPRLFVEFGTQDPPVFTLQPTNTTVEQARTARFTVTAEGSLPISYQWYKDDVAIDPFVNPSATTTTLTLVNVQDTDNGVYYCNASNPIGSTNSESATLTVEPDVTAPLMIGAIGSGTFDSITVQFNEVMHLEETADPFDWSVTSDSGGIAVPSVTLSADGTRATLFFEPGVTLEENTVYTVENFGAMDVSGNFIVPTNLTFRSFVSGCASFVFEAFDTADTPGNLISLLTNHPNYPDNPMTVANIPSWDTRHGYPDNSHEQYGGRIRGFFIPNVTGPWVFFHRSDDAGQLWLNPSGTDPAGKQLIAVESGCCGNFRPHGDPRTSAPFDLVAGQAYYMESLYKEGTGGDWLKVAARLASEPVPTDGFGDADTAIDANAIPAGAGPAGVLAHITIANQPASQSRIAGQTAVFSVALSQDIPGCFQWKRDGVDIPGAIGRSYRFATTLADNGARFSVTVSLLGGTVLNSDEAILTVEDDTTPPTALSASTDASGTNITVIFSEPMDATVQDPFSYQVDSGAVTISQVTVVNATTVRLTVVSPLATCVSHTVTISDVQDQFGNTIDPNPTTLSFTVPLLLVAMDDTQNWRYEESGNELGDAWYATLFDDSAWSNGVPTFGVENAAQVPAGFPIRTPHNWTPVKPSVYYRTHFDLPTDPSTVTRLQIRHYIDDGGVFYLNGQELTRIRIPAGPVDTSVLAENATENGAITVTDVPADALQFGDNVLAARVHQSSTTSSDVVFLAGLVAEVSACIGERPRLSIERNGAMVTVSVVSGPGGTIYRASSLDGPWTAVGPAPQTLAIDLQQAQVFFEIRP